MRSIGDGVITYYHRYFVLRISNLLIQYGTLLPFCRDHSGINGVVVYAHFL